MRGSNSNNDYCESSDEQGPGGKKYMTNAKWWVHGSELAREGERDSDLERKSEGEGKKRSEGLSKKRYSTKGYS